MAKTAQNPQLSEDTVKPSTEEMQKAMETLRGVIPAEEIEIEEPKRPVGELAEAYVAVKNHLDRLMEEIDSVVKEGNRVGAQLLKHYGMRVPEMKHPLFQSANTAIEFELPTAANGAPVVVNGATSVAQIRADAAAPSGDESSFANSVAANLQSALRALK